MKIASLLLFAAVLAGCGDAATRPGVPARFLTARVSEGRGLFEARFHSAAWSPSTGMLTLSGLDVTEPGAPRIDIRVHSVSGPGIYPLGGPTSLGMGAFTTDGRAPFETNLANSGALVITRLDPAAREITGAFQFDAVDDEESQVIVSDGQYDLPLGIEIRPPVPPAQILPSEVLP